jgi:hypothetical protein
MPRAARLLTYRSPIYPQHEISLSMPFFFCSVFVFSSQHITNQSDPVSQPPKSDPIAP